MWLLVCLLYNRHTHSVHTHVRYPHTYAFIIKKNSVKVFQTKPELGANDYLKSCLVYEQCAFVYRRYPSLNTIHVDLCTHRHMMQNENK